MDPNIFEFEEKLQRQLKEMLPFWHNRLRLCIYSRTCGGNKQWELELGEEAAADALCSKEKILSRVADARHGQWGIPKQIKCTIQIPSQDSAFAAAVKKGEREALESFLGFILDCLDFDNCMLLDMLRENDETASCYLLENIKSSERVLRKYAEAVLDRYRLPSARILTQLSAQFYEHRPLKGRIFFADEESLQNFNTGLSLENIDEAQRQISMDNMRILRKLLEMTSDGACLLARTGMPDVITDLVNREALEGLEGVLISFDGYSRWRVEIDDFPWVSYNNGLYKLEEGMKAEADYDQDMKELALENKENIKKIIPLLKMETHGTAVVFMTKELAREEAKRLHGMNRAVFLGEDGADLESCLRILPGITAIDGALMAGFDGRCYGLSVILDGEAVKKGRTSRGARYNSIVNYVHLRKEEEALGVIVSEDEDVDIIASEGLRKGKSGSGNDEQ